MGNRWLLIVLPWLGALVVVGFWVLYFLLCFLPCIEGVKNLAPLLQERKTLINEALQLIQ